MAKFWHPRHEPRDPKVLVFDEINHMAREGVRIEIHQADDNQGLILKLTKLDKGAEQFSLVRCGIRLGQLIHESYLKWLVFAISEESKENSI